MTRYSGTPGHLEPAADAAALLRRVGFVTLAVALPVAAMVSRRASVLLAPIGVILLIIAAIVENPAWFAKRLKRIFTTRTGALLVLLGAWVFFAAAWSPFKATAPDKAASIAFAILAGMTGAAALPERMKASNLNLIAVGAGLAAVFALIFMFRTQVLFNLPPINDANASLGRGFAVLAVLVWPAVAWLLSRNRTTEALVLAGLATVIALARIGQGGTAAMIMGAGVYVTMTLRPPLIGRLLGAGIAFVVVAAPLSAFLWPPLASVFGTTGLVAGASAWADVIMASPVKLLTGHGLDSALYGKISGILPLSAPSGFLFEIWHELGMVGAIIIATLLFGAINAATRMPAPLAAGGVAAYLTAFVLAVMDQAAMQGWWLFTLATVGILFTAIARGQYRTDRPKAAFKLRRNDLPGP
jgi:uncharacterized membrane protein SirB2